jgi:uncharacterized protein (TIGR00369 family)
LLPGWQWESFEMSQIRRERVPEGFEPVPDGLGFTDVLQPLYRKVQGESISLGLLVDSQHSNTMGICHGGVLMTLADIAAGSGVNIARGVLAGAPTVNLSLDFIAAARMGQWLQADVHLAEVKRHFGFASGIIHTSERLVARYNGTFYFPDHDGMWKDGKTEMAPLKGLGDGL